MPTADDLSGLLLPPGGEASDIGFRQGIILAWDASAGTNTVQVAGTSLTNIPLLAASGAVVLLPGDIVGILRVRSQYFILGRITPPGGERNAGFAGWMDAGQGTWGQWYNTTNTTAYDEVLTGTISKRCPQFQYLFGIYVAPSTTASWHLVINGTQVDSTSIAGGGSGAITSWGNLIDWPSGTDYYESYGISLQAKITAGTGKAAAAVRALYNESPT